MGHEIYRATEFDILPLKPDISVHHPPHPVEAHLLALVRSHLNGGNFIFAYGWDVTRRLQAQWESQDKAAQKHLWEMVRAMAPATCSSPDTIARPIPGSFGTGAP